MRALTAVALLVALVACGADSTSPDMSSASGDYTETLYMKPSGAFSDVTHYRRTDVGLVDMPADTLDGSWSMKGNVVSFTGANGAPFVGTIGGVSLLIEGEGLAFRYIK